MAGGRGEGSDVAPSPKVGTSAFRDLTAYRASVELADELHGAVNGWASLDRWSLGLQLLRAADSVGANIAEAAGRWHVRDRRQLLFVARGSLYETEHWILRAEARGLLEHGKSERIAEVARALNGLIKKEPPD